ncbi:MAG: glycoside hydrolase family 127 protein [Pirellulales bacterium]|nr:glycoside hydrolase family 127 protein [Pirellulales bacterium]
MNDPQRFLFGFLHCLTICCLPVIWATAAQASDALTPLKIDDVKVGGEIGRRIDMTIQSSLNKLDLEGDFIKPFRKKDRSSGFIGVGMLMDSAVGLAAYSGDKEAIKRKTQLVEEMIKLQEPDGYVGMFKPSRRLWFLWDIHEMSYIMRGWLRDYRLFGNRRALEAACKTADYIVDNWSAQPDRGFDGGIHTVMGATGIEPLLLDLYNETKNKKYLDFVVKIRKLPEWKHEIVLGRFGDIYGHAYAHMSRCIAQLQLYRLQPEALLLDGSHDVVEFLTHGNGMSITGACGDHECWHNTQEGTINLGETCATAYIVRLADELGRMEGKSCYGDIMERSIFNTLFAAQSPDGRKIRYYTPMEGKRSYFNGDTYCCPCNYRRVMSEIPKMIYYRSKNGVVVNLYTASSAKFKFPSGMELVLRQETDYPNSGKVVIHVDPAKAAEFPVDLRIPAWCDGATVKVNGKAVEGAGRGERPTPGSFFTIARKWKSGDRVELDMPMPTRLVKGRVNQAGRVAIMRGPLVFCLNPSKDKQLEDVDLRLLVIDIDSLEGPIADSTIRPNGLAYKLKAWGPGVWYPHKKPNINLNLTEFIDPNGKATYFKVPNPGHKDLVDDELTK